MQVKRRSIGYFIVWGILGWGIPMFVLMSLLPVLRGQREMNNALTIGLPIWIVGGALFGLGMGYVTGWTRKKELDNAFGDASVTVSPSATYSIVPRAHRVIAIVGILFFGFCAVLSIAAGEFLVGSLFGLVFFIPCVLFLLYCGPIEVSDRGVRHISSYGVSEMTWDEVTHIERDPQGTALVFRGVNKRLPIPGAGSWKGPQSKEFAATVQQQIQKRGIETRENRLAGMMSPKNVKARARN